MRFKAIVMGVSTGGVKALKFIFESLPADFPLPILVVSHILPEADNGLAILLDSVSGLNVKEADDGEALLPYSVYLAPPNYHLMVDGSCCVALSVDPPVNFARPSVDVLFESAALVFGSSLIGVILTGAGNDGANGLASVKKCGGITIVQDPADAEKNNMPINAIRTATPDFLCCLKDLPELLQKMVNGL